LCIKLVIKTSLYYDARSEKHHIITQVYFFLYNKTNQINQFPKFTRAWNSTCFGQFLCPSSEVYSLYTRDGYMSYRSENSFRAGPSCSCSKAVYIPVWHIPLLNAQWINSWWTDELSETCRVSRQNKFVKLVHLVGFITKKSVTMHGNTNVKDTHFCHNNKALRNVSMDATQHQQFAITADAVRNTKTRNYTKSYFRNYCSISAQPPVNPTHTRTYILILFLKTE
jgi:hypothetical protein